MVKDVYYICLEMFNWTLMYRDFRMPTYLRHFHQPNWSLNRISLYSRVVILVSTITLCNIIYSKERDNRQEQMLQINVPDCGSETLDIVDQGCYEVIIAGKNSTKVCMYCKYRRVSKSIINLNN